MSTQPLAKCDEHLSWLKRLVPALDWLRHDSRRAETIRTHRRDLELHAIDVLKRYCAAHPCVNADLQGTVIAV